MPLKSCAADVICCSFSSFLVLTVWISKAEVVTSILAWLCGSRLSSRVVQLGGGELAIKLLSVFTMVSAAFCAAFRFW